MSSENWIYSLAVDAVGTCLVAACSVPSVSTLARRLFGKHDTASHDHGKLYEDEDGQSTEESEKQMATFIPRFAGLSAAMFGTLSAVSFAVLTSSRFSSRFHPHSGWLNFASWVLVLLQSVSVFTERRPLVRFGHGLLAALSCLFIAVVLFLEHQKDVFNEFPAIRSLNGLVTIQCALLAVAFFSFLTIQRRPKVFKDGKPVDGRFTSSMLGRLTFSWASPILQYACKHKNLELEDLPKLSAFQRSQVMEAVFRTLDRGARLWITLARQYWQPLFMQAVLVSLVGVFQFAPQFAMLKMLELLETRSDGQGQNGKIWVWVFMLGAFMLLSTVLESLLYFSAYSDISMPMRSLLSVLVFSKSTRRKDVKGEQKKDEKSTDSDGDGKKTTAKDSTDDEDDGDSVTKSRQATINLVGVDAKWVADFFSYVHIYPGVVVKLTVSMTFLWKLVGWQSLLSGLAAVACTFPINIVISKLYNNAQGKLMSLRDSKLAVINEALQGIRQIKFSAIEQEWQGKIAEKRETELKTQWQVFCYDTLLSFCWVFGPVMLSAICLCVYTLIHGGLSPSVAFTTISVLSQIEFTLAIIPELTAEAIDAFVALNRIEKYLKAAEVVETSVPGRTIKFENATVAWPADDPDENLDRFTLKNLNLEFPEKELSVISGKTGSGKSLLLAAILGEIDKLDGTIHLPRAPSVADRFDHRANPTNWIIDSSVAFVAQIPWIENATIKENILFGLPFDKGRYRKTLQACTLEKDLDILPDGDMTDIGANGINLSGGQRWRVSFARAMYSRAGTLILDDIFSAVDAHVGRQLFEDALTGELGAGRTRILVTHHVGLCLPKTKFAVHLGDGTVQHSGFVEGLRERGDIAEILREEAESNLEVDQDLETVEEAETGGNGADLMKVASRRSVRSSKIDDGGVDTKGKGQPKKFNEDEKRETGGIKMAVYWQYIMAGGGLLVWIPLILNYGACSALTLARSYWVALWTRSYETESTHAIDIHFHPTFQVPLGNNSLFAKDLSAASSSDSSDLWFWLGIYLGLSCTAVIIGTSKYFMSYYASILASRKLFDEMSYAILRAPLRWLDTIPVGRILNRFSSDFNTIDSRIAMMMAGFFYQSLEAVAITVAGIVASPIMLPFAAALTFTAVLIMRTYLGGAREVKRLESNARSPIFSEFGALLTGVATVRAFDKTKTYIDRMYDRVDTHGTSYFHVWLFNRWMGFRMGLTGILFAIAVAVIIVASGRVDAALAGFALNFALRYTTAIEWSMRRYANVEMDLNSAERVIEYSKIDIEDQSGNSPPAAWPTSGRLEVDNLVAAYAPDLPPVLKGLTFAVESGQRVGVVGRTGAGKSSLTLALFRFINQREGTVYVDGLDVSKIKLHDLRSRLAIIPQDPVLFSGTVRSNLDPFNQHSDAELRAALLRVHLVTETDISSSASLAAEPEPNAAAAGQVPGSDERVTAPETSASNAPPATSDQVNSMENKNVFSSLSSKISEGGLNLSQGQRQLLCLARAIVSRPRLMVLDEATSAVDMATDELIQRSIREEFQGSTLLVIAHRLSTIADFDRILVMSEGQAVEFGTPTELMKLKEGVFKGMVENSGESERLVDIIKQSSS